MKTARCSGRIAIAVVAFALSVPSLSAQQEKRRFDIPSGPAARAIAEFARQADANVLAPGEHLANLHLNEVKGNFSVAEALERLLAGKGYIGKSTPDGTVVILPAPKMSVDPVEQPEEQAVVVIPGFRASVDTALELKRQADGIVDAIVAEDVSRFPDANLAESLQRVPGVALTRGEGGEGRQITVRGLSPRYTRVRINGIEAAVASGASDINGNSNRTRAFDFSVFASELFSKLEVRKTSQADVEEGSLGATVDLRTARPFDFKGRTFSVGGQEVWNSVARKSQPRLAGLYSNRWETGFGKVGILFSAAFAKRRATEEGYEAGEIQSASTDGGFCSPLGYQPLNPGVDGAKGIDAAYCGFGVPRLADATGYQLAMARTDDYGGTVATPAPGSGAFHPRLPRYRRSQTDYERSGLTGSFQWRSATGTELNVDLMFGKFANVRRDQYIEAISFGRSLGQANGKPQTSIIDAHFDNNGSWDYGNFNAVDIRSEALQDVFATIFRQHVISATHRLSEGFRLNALFGISNSALDQPMRTTVSFDASNADNFAYDFRSNRNVPALHFGIDVSNPANFTFARPEADGTFHGQFMGRVLHTQNKLKTGELSGTWDISDNLSLKTGFSRHVNTWTNGEMAFGGPGLPLPAGATVADVTTVVTGFGRGLGAAVPSTWVTVDLPRFLQAVDLNCHCSAVPGSPYRSLAQLERSVGERIDALYGKVDFHYDLGGVALRGNAGLRAVSTEMTAKALNNAGDTLVPVVAAKSYRDLLPALNVTAQLPRGIVLRYSSGKTLSRPEYLDLTPQATVSSQTQFVSIGNPNLDPVRGTTQDLQLEWYYDKNAVVSLGFFHKRIGTYIQNVSERVPWKSLGLPDSMLASGGCSTTGGTPACPTLPDTEVVVDRKVNTPGGPLNGFEFNLQAPFTFLPGRWRNFGLLANYTHVQSKITYITRADNPATAVSEQLTQVANFTGLSPRTHNLTLYYEDRRLSARISAAHRSRYLTSVMGNVTGSDYNFVDGGTQVDMSLAYQLTPRLRFRIEGQNLTDQPLRYGRDLQRNDILLYVHFGRSLMIGLSYNY